jgi:hypothetical protein
VSGGILQLLAAVLIGRNNLAIGIEEHRPDRDVTVFSGESRFGEGGPHGGFE